MAIDKTEILTTNSVNSWVKDREGEVIGHVILCDYDAMGSNFESDIDKLDGMTLVLESSENSYHLWNLKIRSLPVTALRMLELHGDASHIPPGFRRGFWRLRAGEKRRQSQGIYKDRPELKAVYWNETDEPHSKPHFRVARALFDDLPASNPVQEWVGESLSVSEYLTLTDELKDKLKE